MKSNKKAIQGSSGDKSALSHAKQETLAKKQDESEKLK